jgi:hypothetical protein
LKPYFCRRSHPAGEQRGAAEKKKETGERETMGTERDTSEIKR